MHAFRRLAVDVGAVQSGDRLTSEEWLRLRAIRREAGLIATLILLIAAGVMGLIASVLGMDRTHEGLLIGWVLLAGVATYVVWHRRARTIPVSFRERVAVVRRAHVAWWWAPYAVPLAGGLLVVGAAEVYHLPTWIAMPLLGLVAVGSPLLESASARWLVEGRA